MEVGPKREKYTRVIANIFIVIGILGLLSSSLIYNVFEFLEGSDYLEELDVIHLGVLTFHDPFRFFYVFPTLTFIFALLKLSAGLGLASKKPWAEKLSLVLAFFMLFSVPLGTAFAVFIFYTFVDNKKPTFDSHSNEN